MPQNPEKRDEDREKDNESAPSDEKQNPSEDQPDKERTSNWNRRAVTFGLAATTMGGIAGASTQPAAPAAGESSAPPVPAAAEFSIPAAWDIESTKNEQVDFFIEFLMFKNRDKTKLWLERLGYYGPMIQQKLAEHGMPKDMIWLAMIESGLDPNAYSRADAAGLWQFIEETGRRYGLEVSDYVDERRDPVKATDAALTYLKEMNQKFGSWYLAAAGYNTGENRVERIVNEKAGGRFGEESVFWDIEKDLPDETRDYVPLMLAMGHIGKNPAQYGFTDLQPQKPYSYEEMRVPGNVPLARVAQDLGVDPQVIYDLNPHLIKKKTPPDREWNVRIPVGAGAKFAAA